MVTMCALVLSSIFAFGCIASSGGTSGGTSAGPVVAVTSGGTVGATCPGENQIGCAATPARRRARSVRQT